MYIAARVSAGPAPPSCFQPSRILPISTSACDPGRYSVITAATDLGLSGLLAGLALEAWSCATTDETPTPVQTEAAAYFKQARRVTFFSSIAIPRRSGPHAKYC